MTEGEGRSGPAGAGPEAGGVSRRAEPGLPNRNLPLPGIRSLPGGPLVVAVSGGVDSMVLLHALRFRGREGRRLVVAHLDHGMRPGSDRDAAWLAGVCRAWSLPLERRRLAVAPRSEDEARDARYAFLEGVRRSTGAEGVVTAHHADDQAETILFRILRGTGLRGLEGMRPERGWLFRPLLGVRKEELLRYARRHRVPCRADATNRQLRFARNALRHEILPAAESRVAPAATEALLRLGRNAARAREETKALEGVAFRGVLHRVGPDRMEMDEHAVRSWPRALRRRLLRAAAAELGPTLSEAATLHALERLPGLQRGRGMDLGGGLRLERGFGTWILTRPGNPVWDALVLEGKGAGEDRVRLGHRHWLFRWGPRRDVDGGQWTLLPVEGVLPLTVRGWRPGDRIRLPFGSKSVAKLLAECGVPSSDRPDTPVALDARCRVVWVPGVARAHGLDVPSSTDSLHISCVAIPNG